MFRRAISYIAKLTGSESATPNETVDATAPMTKSNVSPQDARDAYQRQFDDFENDATRFHREALLEENWRNDGHHH